MFNRVLILSASAGAGHLRAAEAIERAFARTGAAREVRHIDVLQHTNPLFRNLYSKTYLDMVNTMPEVLGWLYDRLDKPNPNDPLRMALEKLNALPFIRLLDQYQPEITVCTHFLPAEIISWLKAKGRLAARQAVVVTDFDVHAMWLCGHYEQYFVALDETRAHLVELGVPESKVSVTGIPIDPVFAEPKDKAAMRRKHGLDPDPGRATILISAGGFGVGRVETLLAALAKLRHPAQVVAVCGRNRELHAELEARAAAQPADTRVKLKAVGFTTEMDELMAASDLIVGKPGGLTTSEALARGLVFVVVNPIPGQEERNSDHLLEEGAAIRCNNLPVLAYKIDRLLDDPARLAAMRANARRLGRPDAARDVVNRLLTLRDEPTAPVPAPVPFPVKARVKRKSVVRLSPRPPGARNDR
jgi:processive 1,2-diacylglycerol beta-glucosyltransferase